MLPVTSCRASHVVYGVWRKDMHVDTPVLVPIPRHEGACAKFMLNRIRRTNFAYVYEVCLLPTENRRMIVGWSATRALV